MSILETLREELEKPDLRAGCALCDYIATLPSEIGEGFEGYLRRPLSEVSNARVERALAREGVVLSTATISRHRHGHQRTDRP